MPKVPSPWRIIDPVRPQIRRAMMLSTAAIAFGTAALLLMAHILKELLAGRADWFAAALLVALTFVAFALRGYAFRVSHLAAFRLETLLRNRLADHLARVPLGFLHDRGAAALTKVMQDDVRGLHVFVADSTPLYARAYAAPLLTFAVLLFIDWKLALVAAGVVAVGMVIFGLGTPDASDSEVEAAARAAQCHDFIMTLPDSYQTAVGERGATLSGGERQRTTIARAILQNRPILILDEATAFADAENEALLMRALAALMQDKTVLMIAHRLATIRHAAQILVFDHGQLVEQGDHASLIAQNGRYARLWQASQTAQNWQIGASH